MPGINQRTERKISVKNKEQAAIPKNKQTARSSNPLVRFSVWFQGTALYLWAYGLFKRIKAFFTKDEANPESSPTTSDIEIHNKPKQALKHITIKSTKQLASWNPLAAHSINTLSGCTHIPSADDLGSLTDGAMGADFSPQKSIDMLVSMLTEGMRLLNENAKDSLSPEIQQQLIKAHEQIINVTMASYAPDKVIEAFEPLLQLTDSDNSRFLKNIHRISSLLKNQLLQKSLTNEILDIEIQQQNIDDEYAEIEKTHFDIFTNPQDVIPYLIIRTKCISLSEHSESLAFQKTIKIHEKQSLLIQTLLSLQDHNSQNNALILKLKKTKTQLAEQNKKIMLKLSQTAKSAKGVSAALKIIECIDQNKDNTDAIVESFVTCLKTMEFQNIGPKEIKDTTHALSKSIFNVMIEAIKKPEVAHLVNYLKPEPKKQLLPLLNRYFNLERRPDWKNILHEIAKKFNCEKAFPKA